MPRTCHCGQPATRRGLCDPHFAAHFLGQLPARYIVDAPTGCWLWNEGLSAAGVIPQATLDKSGQVMLESYAC